MNKRLLLTFVSFLTANLFFVFSHTASAHCDTLDGPVVAAARQALETGNANHVLMWVQSKDEKEIRDAFQKTLNVRKAGGEAKELADRYFFETLVRVHRAGEGAPYTGLKANSEDLGPAIPAADKAIASGKLEPVTKLLQSLIQTELNRNFQKVVHSKKFDVNDLGAGRDYVANYVSFIHAVERVYDAAKAPAHGHSPEHEEQDHHP